MDPQLALEAEEIDQAVVHRDRRASRTAAHRHDASLET